MESSIGWRFDGRCSDLHIEALLQLGKLADAMPFFRRMRTNGFMSLVKAEERVL